MNPAPAANPNTSQNQHAWRTRFFTRLQRVRSLLLSKWWLPALGLAIGIGVETSLWMTQKPTFISSGRMIVSMKLSIPEGSVYTEEWSNFLGTQAALMQSGAVLSQAHARVTAENPKLTAQPVALKVTILPKTTIFLLQATGDDPAYTQKFLQACMEEYELLKIKMRTQTSDKTLAGLSEEVEQLRKDMAQSSKELEAFQGSNSVVVLDQQGNSAGNYLTALNQRLAGLKSEHDLLQTLSLEQNLERRQSGGSTLASPDQAATPISSSPLNGNDTSQADYFKAKQSIALLKAQKEDWSEFLRPKHPRIVGLDEEIARRQRLLVIFKDQSGEQLESMKSSLALQIQNLEKDVHEWEGKCLQISRKMAEYQRLKSDSERIKGLYERLLAMIQTLDVNKTLGSETVAIYEKASPAYPDKANLATKLLMGAAAGLGLSVLILLFLDRLDDRMSSFTELQELFDEEVLAQIPREIKARGVDGPPLICQDGPPHNFVEAYRNLRSSLLYMGGENGSRPKTLLVTSSAPGEGKSLTATNLAAMLASSGSKVLLVDADLRRGVLHTRFGMQSGPGLTEVLTDGINMKEAIFSTTVPNLWLLPRGSVTTHSSELFISKVAGAFLKDVAAQYDYVVIDTAPVMAADDVASLAPHTDSTIFLIRAEQTSARVARAALDLLYQRRVKVMGLVFNAVRPTSADYYYSKYAEYYRTYPGKN